MAKSRSDPMTVMRTTSELSSRDRWDHILARLGYKRMQHRVTPGIYELNEPNSTSPVFVTANYTLSFDALRSSLHGISCYILVLDTKGVNVWCAAGKGTFSTEELVRQVKQARLEELVAHRRLILPQLGAPGVSAVEVFKQTGFKVEYGPVRAADLPQYLRLGYATEEMRTVKFPLRDRAVLIPVEIKNYFWLAVLLPIALFLLFGPFPSAVAVTAILGGIVLFPLGLPILPTRDFTSKGLVLGALLSIPFILYPIYMANNMLQGGIMGLASALVIISSVAYMALNFTGCSTTASRTGVRKEIFRYIPILTIMLIVGLVISIFSFLASWQGWW
ncbi:MAG: mercury methylation corrinoid protein HgcA [Methanomassiliicoccales archaeon]